MPRYVEPSVPHFSTTNVYTSTKIRTDVNTIYCPWIHNNGGVAELIFAAAAAVAVQLDKRESGSVNGTSRNHHRIRHRAVVVTIVSMVVEVAAAVVLVDSCCCSTKHAQTHRSTDRQTDRPQQHEPSERKQASVRVAKRLSRHRIHNHRCVVY